MKTSPAALIFSAGIIIAALLLALAAFAEDPLDARYRECIRQACRGYGHIENEAQAVALFSDLRLAKEKLQRCRSLKAQLCRISTGPVAGLGAEPGHCREAYEQLRREIHELLNGFEKHLLHSKPIENASL